MELKQEIHARLNEFLNLCQDHNVKTLYAFGSSVTGGFDEKTSDIDFLVELEEVNPVERGEKLMSLWDKFEEFFHRKVDLMTNSSIKNPLLRKNIDKTKVLIYEGKRRKVVV